MLLHSKASPAEVVRTGPSLEEPPDEDEAAVVSEGAAVVSAAPELEEDAAPVLAGVPDVLVPVVLAPDDEDPEVIGTPSSPQAASSPHSPNPMPQSR